jgi:Na+-transporting methylmalonyl-CoA/oxaloacetate decarboxylase gamma subunit
VSDLAFGLQITVLGMGLVFGLLALLWALLALAGRLEARAAPPPTVVAPEAPTLVIAPTGNGSPALRVRGPGADELAPEAAAAIAAAVIAHIANRRRQAAPETRSYAPGSLLFASRWVIAGRTRQNRQRGDRRS